ncbi:hypothetical protein L841_0075 [Mycobacterium sp. MAC_080597_8934]|uniref:DUF2742 domain-containing protein n=1 Tax=unclassified Mycobacterium avium complex (MAC) TaxID=2750822 RepID=UPI000449F36A|nr:MULTISPECIES: DUF2742 domain-containing protein [unclassified Mycobacterium avium complex (MAC)]ETZ58168.1 hypothetical protein L840_2870 [Mycobacterium sp. MAC_011194_8550]ETZ75117.1 hypothetical protein L841_0075 [Mycobacterium sp. MAC_080597_8934]
MTDYRTESRQVDFYMVHLFVAPMLHEAGSWPLAGSYAWQQLDATDPRKLAAVLDGGRRDALRNDTISAALTQAAQGISASSDWSGLSRSIRRRSGVYIPREVA